MVRAGDMRFQVSLERRSSTQDVAGEPVDSWVVFATRRCAIERFTGREVWTSEERHARTPTVFRLRYLEGVEPDMRLMFGTRSFNILSVVDVGELHEQLIITAEEELEANVLSGTSTVYTKTFTVMLPAAADLSSVHASVLATAVNAFPGPFTDPDFPRNLQVDLASGWDGGDITIAGTDQFDAAVIEVFTTGSGVTRVGTKIFKTVTAISKASVGVAAAGATVGVGNKLGVVGRLADTESAILMVNNAAEPATLDDTYDAFTPTVTVPNGSASYALLVNVSE
jgi:SPP1 family predicted phage head-tail adaptor